MVTIQLVPYHSITNLTSVGRIRKLLNIAKDNKIVLLQGRLKKEEEAELIQATMEEINKDFKGIELAVINGANTPQGLGDRFRNMLLGDRTGMTIIGPATIVKSIKRNPNKIELMLSKGKSISKKKKNTRRR